MKKLNIILVFITAILLTISVSACSGKNADLGGNTVTVDEALRLWQNKEAVIIDVRTMQEYQAGHIPEVPLLPLNELESRTDEVPRNQKVLFICRSGNRSGQAVSLLKNKGFDNLYNIEGGMLAWRGPVIK